MTSSLKSISIKFMKINQMQAHAKQSIVCTRPIASSLPIAAPLSSRHPDTAPPAMPKNDHERLLSLIEREFDLELLLKLRELKEIEGEMQRGEELRSLVEKLILNGKCGCGEAAVVLIVFTNALSRSLCACRIHLPWKQQQHWRQY